MLHCVEGDYIHSSTEASDLLRSNRIICDDNINIRPSLVCVCSKGNDAGNNASDISMVLCKF
jgi:hypothetical protein